eukprot:g41615.t1
MGLGWSGPGLVEHSLIPMKAEQLEGGSKNVNPKKKLIRSKSSAGGICTNKIHLFLRWKKPIVSVNALLRKKSMLRLFLLTGLSVTSALSLSGDSTSCKDDDGRAGLCTMLANCASPSVPQKVDVSVCKEGMICCVSPSSSAAAASSILGRWVYPMSIFYSTAEPAASSVAQPVPKDRSSHEGGSVLSVLKEKSSHTEGEKQASSVAVPTAYPRSFLLWKTNPASETASNDGVHAAEAAEGGSAATTSNLLAQLPHSKVVPTMDLQTRLKVKKARLESSTMMPEVSKPWKPVANARTCRVGRYEGECIRSSLCEAPRIKAAGQCGGSDSDVQCCYDNNETTFLEHQMPGADFAMCEGISSDRAGILKAAHHIVDKPVKYSQRSGRWSGIDGHVCPTAGKYMPYADCSSLVTWVYWTAFGKGVDFVNGQNWKAGYSGVMGFKGKHVSLDEAEPGDIFLHGHPINHATIYLGGRQVLSLGSPKHYPRIQDMCNGFGCPVTVIQHLPVFPHHNPWFRLPRFLDPSKYVVYLLRIALAAMVCVPLFFVVLSRYCPALSRRLCCCCYWFNNNKNERKLVRERTLSTEVGTDTDGDLLSTSEEMTEEHSTYELLRMRTDFLSDFWGSLSNRLAGKMAKKDDALSKWDEWQDSVYDYDMGANSIYQRSDHENDGDMEDAYDYRPLDPNPKPKAKH